MFDLELVGRQFCTLFSLLITTLGLQVSSAQQVTLTGVNDADYQPPFTFTGKLNKVTLTIDRPKLSPDDIKKLQRAEQRAAQTRE